MVNRVRNEDPRSPLKFKQCLLKGGTEKSDIPLKEEVQGRIRERNLMYPRTESTKPNAYELTGVVLWVQLWSPVRYIQVPTLAPVNATFMKIGPLQMWLR